MRKFLTAAALVAASVFLIAGPAAASGHRPASPSLHAQISCLLSGKGALRLQLRPQLKISFCNPPQATPSPPPPPADDTVSEYQQYEDATAEDEESGE